MNALLLDIAAKGTILLLVTSLLAVGLRRGSASLRHYLWALALFGLLLLPGLSLALPGWRLPLLPAESAPPACAESAVPTVESTVLTPSPPTTPAVLTPLPPTTEGLPAPSGIQAPAAVVGERPPAPEPLDAEPAPAPAVAAAPVIEADDTAASMTATEDSAAPPWLLLAWILGLFTFLLPLPAGMLAARRVARRARPPRDPRVESVFRALAGILCPGRHVRLRLSERTGSPMAWGLLRPVVLLPADALGWSRSRLRLVLTHELAHVRRRDCAIEALARAGRAVHWFNPLAWLGLRRLRIERERACDDAVLAAGSRPGDYADCLLGIVREARCPTPALAVPMAGRTLLESRLRAILDRGRNRRMPRRSTRALALVLAVTLVSLLAAAHLAPRPAEAGPDVDMAITVATDGSGDFTSLEEAIEAAPAGALIRMAPGTYEGPFVIEKPLILEGAGWERTILVSTREAAKPEDAAKRAAELAADLRGAGSAAERRAILSRFRRSRLGLGGHTLLVTHAEGVTLRGLQINQRGPHPQGAVMSGAALVFRHANARVSGCAVVGSPASGILIGTGSDVTVEDSLVAAAWATGIQVGERGGGLARARILTTEVRNCHHRGIVVTPGNDAVLILGCRISGSAWHGIRYDHASPTIRENLIWRNARSGIYASGWTAATVRGNLFFENGFDDISCWSGNHDTIERNTFVRSGRSSVEVTKLSRPVLGNNVFFAHPAAVTLYMGGASAEGRPAVDLDGNWFWENGKALVHATAEGPVEPDLTPGNRIADPGFTDPGRNDFTLPADSPATLGGAGASSAPPVASLWPVQPAEETMQAERGVTPTKEEATSAADAGTRAYGLSKQWSADIAQIRDDEKRKAALEKVRAAMKSVDPVENWGALMAFTASHDVAFDRASYRESILELVGKLTGAAQVSAFYALYHSERRPEDLDLVIEALEEPSPEMRESGSHLLYMYSLGEVSGKVAAAVLKLLASKDQNVLREVMRGIWGAKASQEVQDRLLEIARRPECRYDAVYYALSTLNNKSKGVVEFLVEAATTDRNSRALWGLTYGVTPEGRQAAADAFLGLLENRESPSVRKQCLDALEDYGSEKHLAALEKFAANEMVSENLRRLARQAIQRIRRRAGAKKPAPPEPANATGKTLKAAAPTGPTSAEARKLSRPWVEDITQIRDKAKRDAAVAEVRKALGSTDPLRRLAGLQAVRSTFEAKYDKASLRELVLPLVMVHEGSARLTALYALLNTGRRPEDLDLVLRALTAPSRQVRESASHLIRTYTEGRISGRAADAVLELLDTDEGRQLREVCRGLWGARVSPEVEKRLIEIADTDDWNRRYETIYFALSTFPVKSRAAIEVLIEAAGDSNANLYGRALWGLGYGIPEEHHAMVADALVVLLENRDSGMLARDCLRLLGEYGDRSHLEALEKYSANEMASENLRNRARQAIQSIRHRTED